VTVARRTMVVSGEVSFWSFTAMREG